MTALPRTLSSPWKFKVIKLKQKYLNTQSAGKSATSRRREQEVRREARDQGGRRESRNRSSSGGRESREGEGEG